MAYFESVEKRMTRGQSLKLAALSLRKIADALPETSSDTSPEGKRLLVKADYEEAIEHIKFINQFYM